jgi:ribosomal protein S12 methylthiotransferase
VDAHFLMADDSEALGWIVAVLLRAGVPFQLPAKVKKARHKRAMLTQQTVSREVQARFVGQTLRVLVEKPGVARSHADAPEIDGTVKIAGAAPVGEFANVRITGASEYDLTAEVTH